MTATRRNHTTSSHRKTKHPRQANTHQRQRPLMPGGGGVEKSDDTNSLQEPHDANQLRATEKQPPPTTSHAAPGTINFIVSHGSRLLGFLPSTRLPYVKDSTIQHARHDKHRSPQQRHSLSTEHLASRRPRKHRSTRTSTRYIDETPAVDAAKTHHDTTRICGIHPTKKHYRKNFPKNPS